MSYRETVIAYADQQAKIYQDIALAIHDKPEVSNYEFFASETLAKQLEKEGFETKLDVAGHRTGFTAVYRGAKPGPVLVFLAEYDALAGLGHGCGHNLFGAASSLAAASLKQVIDEVGGEVRVYGTPGEEGGENGSAKGSFVREGFLKDVDAALCAHPGTETVVGSHCFFMGNAHMAHNTVIGDYVIIVLGALAAGNARRGPRPRTGRSTWRPRRDRS